MPQLVPFYFLHLLTFGMLILTMLMYITSKYLLPNMLRLLMTRMLMMKL
uniref:ATP synthase protein 8 n=6 Tax=Metschnikowia TaxID=27320 RepID=A0A7D7FDS8_9ASCO|nr:Atp8 [Metschnikowia dekortorum]YP_009935215.1 Atp8 [Metschnikowia bowlesiae]YP_009935226.1 Atp8 [Metschnikowia similis]QMQ98425.1 Atp8 [Metschnikowia sp. UFMG-CM-y6306]QMQ98450.1 Atp8 [Metschnikowia sp. UWOPS 12.619.2]QMQ98463.1 Atp8 [Metschnikowia sp. UWOPS 03-167b3]QMQ98433.1 Atp8 [Metschnikowia dekortorum]QMQ98483.1 Atp8 [Metschnikowia dekortorum]